MPQVEYGYALSSKEHRPEALVQQAGRAEDAGFGYVYGHRIGPGQDGFLDVRTA